MRKMYCAMFMLMVSTRLVAQTAAPVAEMPKPAEALLQEVALAGRMVIVKTSGGGSFRGLLLGSSAERLELVDGEGRIIAIARASVLSCEEIDLSRDQAEYFQDSAANRLIVMPTGFAMDKGELHVASQEIAVITMSYGLSNRLSLWAGVSIPGAVVNLRWAFEPADRLAISVGGLAGMIWTDTGLLGLPYVLASFGHENRNISIGAGLPITWTPSEGMQTRAAVGTIAGKIIVSPTSSVVTENWIVFHEGESDGWWAATCLPAAVFRIAGERLSWDIGLVLPVTVDPGAENPVSGLADGTLIPIPLLSVTYRLL